ncbi:response regulator transcription factor [Enterococcus saccharolyticus]|uniref:response regulator transcription factor n=1 Tax=Enterococcus saccharolyticus TaxID=41997 RepID=UPI0039E18591
MYHVLIADDHFDQRELLCFLLEKHSEKWIVYEAINGKEALDIFSKHPIDLLITDVQMPFSTGIELAETLRIQHQQLPILFISGYDDFTYAKKAFDLQAVNYLLKPINPEEFYLQLDKLMKAIQKTQIEQQQQQRIGQQDLLIKLFSGVSFEQLGPKEQNMAFSLLKTVTYFLTIDSNHDEAAKLENFLQFYKENTIIVRTSLTRFVYLLSTVTVQEAILKKRELLQQLQEHLGIEVTIEVSQRLQNPLEIYTIYEQHNEQITQKFYKKEKNIVLATKLPTKNIALEEKILNKIKKAIQQQNFELLQKRLSSLFSQYEQAASETPSIVKFFFATTYRTIVETVEINPKEVRSDLEKILDATSFIQIPKAFVKLLKLVEQRFNDLHTTTNEYVRETKNYMWNHYQEELNLEILANNVHLAPKYLSDLFKREEQIGITKYLNEIRMEKAKELLIHSHHRVREISQLVGFNSYSYFIKSFQKYTGVTPESFRKVKGQIPNEK